MRHCFASFSQFLICLHTEKLEVGKKEQLEVGKKEEEGLRWSVTTVKRDLERLKVFVSSITRFPKAVSTAFRYFGLAHGAAATFTCFPPLFLYLLIPAYWCNSHLRDVQASRKADHSKTFTKAEGLSCFGAGWCPALIWVSRLGFSSSVPSSVASRLLQLISPPDIDVPCPYGCLTVPESVQASFFLFLVFGAVCIENVSLSQMLFSKDAVILKRWSSCVCYWVLDKFQNTEHFQLL